MPTIALAPRTSRAPERVAADRTAAGGRGPARGPLLLRAGVLARRRSLTRRLAEGAGPASSPALALRARQLTSDRARRSLGRALRRAVFDAHHPTPTRSVAGVIRRGAVIDAEVAIDLLVKRLRSPVPITAEGAALVERMLSDGAWSPMYRPAGPGALRWCVAVTTATLEPGAV
ncbi:MAG TPA: hypothetical protein VNV17_08390 [Solirubrobacteraceae bacterium]|nr:hypothetical protein [Solirubrobacteraceae bacterium]